MSNKNLEVAIAAVVKHARDKCLFQGGWKNTIQIHQKLACHNQQQIPAPLVSWQYATHYSERIGIAILLLTALVQAKHN